MSSVSSFSIRIGIYGGSGTKHITITEKAWVDALSITRTVNHELDGTASYQIWVEEGGITGTTLNTTTCVGVVKLDTIPRVSSISYVSNVTLGNICTVKWTPHSKGFYYKLKFEVGSWSLTTVAIHPNVTTLYTNASYGISLDAAHQFPNSKDANMTVTLYTYSDSACTKQLGSATASAKVSIPENEDTLPTVAMSLSPVSSLDSQFNGLYIQGKTKVKANFEGSKAKYSASISSYLMEVNGIGTYDSPYQSDLLSKSGTISVIGTAKDSRGCSSSVPQNITVVAYSKPSLIPYTGEKSIVCKRCDSEGNLTTSGTYLCIKAGRKYSKVMVDGVQKNFCLLRYRYKTESATNFSSWETLLAKENATTDEIDLIIENVVSSIKTSYIVQVGVIDDIDEPTYMEIVIPTADVTVHLRSGGKGVGIGKYSEEDNCVDIDEDWELRARGDVAIGGKLSLQGKEVNVVIGEGIISKNTAEGTTVDWHYRKWLNGDAECWCRRNVNANTTYPWGNSGLYYGTVSTINYPFVFAERPMTQITCEYGEDEVSLFIASCGAGTETYATPVMLCRSDSKTDVNCNILYNVHGKWK